MDRRLKTTYSIMGHRVPALIHDAFAVWLRGHDRPFAAKRVVKLFLPWANFKVAESSPDGEGVATLERQLSERIASLVIRRADANGLIEQTESGRFWRPRHGPLTDLLRQFPFGRVPICRRLLRGDTSVGGVLPVRQEQEALPDSDATASMDP